MLIQILEITGLFAGLLCVWLLIKQNIYTWPIGIFYVLVSLIIFWEAKLYADLLLHFLYLFMNFYGWYYWVHAGKTENRDLQVSASTLMEMGGFILISLVGTFIMGYFFQSNTDASLPYLDSATTVFSFTGMWLTARKKIENWYIWLIVDSLAAGIYYYKGLYFYSLLYLIYMAMAVAGYLAWKKSMLQAQVI
ncbi:MAG: nicotinamide mononucleotide transporter [Cyclobacteriaceae bacterium]|nr:nicotinamide mononucleotide transporter [Cyclobacteriaceae bacterium]